MLPFLLLLYRRCGHGIHHSEARNKQVNSAGIRKKNPRREIRRASWRAGSSRQRAARWHAVIKGVCPPVSPLLAIWFHTRPFRRAFAEELEHQPTSCGEARAAGILGSDN